jgi:DNA replication protein DnaC
MITDSDSEFSCGCCECRDVPLTLIVVAKPLSLEISTSQISEFYASAICREFTEMVVSRAEKHYIFVYHDPAQTRLLELFARGSGISVGNLSSRMANYTAETPSQQQTLIMAQEFISATPAVAPRGLFIHGATGIGKSHILTAVAIECVARGENVIYIQARHIHAMPISSRSEYAFMHANQTIIIDDIDTVLESNRGHLIEQLVFHAYDSGGIKLLISSANGYYGTIYQAIHRRGTPLVDRAEHMFAVSEIKGVNRRAFGWIAS